MSNFENVGVFMKTFGQEIKDKPSFPKQPDLKTGFQRRMHEILQTAGFLKKHK